MNFGSMLARPLLLLFRPSLLSPGGPEIVKKYFLPGRLDTRSNFFGYGCVKKIDLTRVEHGPGLEETRSSQTDILVLWPLLEIRE